MTNYNMVDYLSDNKDRAKQHKINRTPHFDGNKRTKDAYGTRDVPASERVYEPNSIFPDGDLDLTRQHRPYNIQEIKQSLQDIKGLGVWEYQKTYKQGDPTLKGIVHIKGCNYNPCYTKYTLKDYEDLIGTEFPTTNLMKDVRSARDDVGDVAMNHQVKTFKDHYLNVKGWVLSEDWDLLFLQWIEDKWEHTECFKRTKNVPLQSKNVLIEFEQKKNFRPVPTAIVNVEPIEESNELSAEAIASSKEWLEGGRDIFRKGMEYQMMIIRRNETTKPFVWR